MQERIFGCEKLSFINRFKKGSTAIILFILVIVSILLITKSDSDHVFFGVTFIGLSYVFIFLIIIPVLKARNYIYKVEISNERLILFGEKFNQEWCEDLKITETDFRIVEHKYRTHSKFLVICISKNSKYTINRLENWNNFILLELYKTLKEFKNEEIGLNEKLVLKALEKKARDEYEWKDT